MGIEKVVGNIAIVIVTCGGVVYYFLKKHLLNGKKFETEKVEVRLKTNPYKDFEKVSRNFDGLYEKLHIAILKNKNEELNSVINNWETKIKIFGTESIKSIWNEYSLKFFNTKWSKDNNNKDVINILEFLKEWYKFIGQTNIQRDESDFIIVTDEKVYEYYYVKNDIYEINTKIKIERASWKLNGNCIEKGYAIVV